MIKFKTPPPGIRHTGKAQPLVDPQEVARALGANEVYQAPSPAGAPHAILALREELFRRLSSKGGRPSLDGAVIRPKVPFTERDWDTLKRIARHLSQSTRAVTPAQIASAIIHTELEKLAVLDKKLEAVEKNLEAVAKNLHDANEELREIGALAGQDQQLNFAKKLYLQIAGPASEVQSFFDEIEAGNLPEFKVAIAPREATSIFTRHTMGYEAWLYCTVEFTAPAAEKLAHDYVKRLIEPRFPQSRIEVKVSEDVPSL